MRTALSLRSCRPVAVAAAAASLIILGVSHPGRANADQPTAVPEATDRVSAGRPDPLVAAQCDAGEPLRPGASLPVAAGMFSTVRFPGRVSASDSPPAAARVIQASFGADVLVIRPAPGATPGAKTTITVRGDGFAPFALPVEIADASADVPGQWTIVPNSRARKRISTTGRVNPGETAPRRPVEFGASIINRTVVIPLKGTTRASTGKLRVWIVDGVWTDNQFYLKVGIVNTFAQPYRLRALSVFDRKDAKHEPEIVHVHEHPSSDPDVIAEIPPAQRTQIVVRVPDAVEHPVDAVRLHATDGGLLGDGWFAVGQWYKSPDDDEPDFDRGQPIIVEWEIYKAWRKRKRIREAEEERRKAEEERKAAERRRKAQRVSVHLLANVGAIWFPDGIDDTAPPKAASLAGAGVRVTKGMTQRLAVEVDLVGATSGTADFGTRTIGMETGDLSRSASLARVSFAGVLRLGETVIPTFRLGVGLLAASQDSTLMTPGGPRPGSAAGIELTETLTGGAGLDYRVSDGLRIGLGINVVHSQNEQLFTRTIEAGANVSYIWAR